jgi:cellulose synthase/poly-beta-1,6-N-acetylglucosamine synthase-like glycosyltransferase
MSDIIVGLYAVSAILITVYTLGQFNLVYYFITPGNKKRFHPKRPDYVRDELPVVTVQLPMYNERYVAEALIDSCAKLDYPADKLEIQVVDDSTDETLDIVNERVEYWTSQGIDIKNVHRENRQGYKAGALRDATPFARGEFIAIFDADFRPKPDFLLKTIPYFQNEKIGIVQGRWGHLNKDYSMLTRSQSLFLDMFFIVEQQARSLAGFFLRFNGSGGVWRKKTIEDAGGWSADTLSEDLDLAFRAQLKDWEVIYDYTVEAPAEIPVTMLDFKAQQYRWTKGKAQVIRKLWKPIRQKKIPFWTKMHVYFDLFNIVTIPSIMVLALLSIPLTFILLSTTEYNTFLSYFALALLNVLLAPWFAWIVMKFRNESKKEAFKELAISFFPFTFVLLGMSVFQLASMLEGFFSDDAYFKRTSKFNITDKKDSWKDKVYRPSEVPLITYLEALCAMYFAYGLYIDFKFMTFGFLPFHLILVTGFSYVFYLSFKRA